MTPSRLAPSLDPATVAAFERDGAIILRGYFGEWIEPLRAGVDEVMAAPSDEG